MPIVNSLDLFSLLSGKLTMMEISHFVRN